MGATDPALNQQGLRVAKRHPMLHRQANTLKSAALFMFLFTALFSLFAAAKPSNKWRIEFDGKAYNEGTIVFRILPPKGEPQDVEVAIPKDKTENAVASLVRDKLKTALGKAYHVERDDFEDVLVKVRGKTPDFGLELASTSIQGLRIKLKRE